jgi:UDP-3-O-[3-hydroxymyristoyl] N-acetylglucosamine deacetylase
LARAVEVEGVGLHSGQSVRVRLCPRDRPGWELARVDLLGAPVIPVAPASVSRTEHATVLERGEARASTVEHLLAALWARGVAACRIEISGSEMPILDGSAQPWCHALDEAGEAEIDATRALYALREPVAVFKGEGCVLGLPHPSLRASVCVGYPTLWDSRQNADVEISHGLFSNEIAPARTFALESWIEPLRAAGLIKGGSPACALILDDSGPSAPWRFPNELARHKMLDLLGDAALLFGRDGGGLRAHLVAVKAGHELHRLWANEVLRRDALCRLDPSTPTTPDSPPCSSAP